jgi:hypothetical protein
MTHLTLWKTLFTNRKLDWFRAVITDETVISRSHDPCWRATRKQRKCASSRGSSINHVKYGVHISNIRILKCSLFTENSMLPQYEDRFLMLLREIIDFYSESNEIHKLAKCAVLKINGWHI